MKPNIITFTQMYLKKCISLFHCLININSSKVASLFRLTVLTSIFHTTFTFAAKDNLYNVTTLAGSGKAGYTDGTGTSASFKGPNGIAVDAAGNIYVSDRENFVIRKITPAGIVTTFAGTAGRTGNTDGTGTSARFSSIMINMTHDNADSLYVSDYGNTLIRRISLSTGAVTTFARSVSQIQGISINNSGDIYFTNPGRNQVMKIPRGKNPMTFAGNTKAGYKNGTGTNSQFRYPCGISANTSTVYVADYNNHLIRQISTGGSVTTLAGVPGSAGYSDGNKTTAKFRNPVDVQSDKSGNLYIADSGNNVIRKISPAGNVTTIAGIAGNAGYVNGGGKNAKFNSPYALTVDNQGNIYVAEYGNHLIRKVTPNYIGLGVTDTLLTNNDYGSFETITLAGGTIKAGTNALTIKNNVLFVNNTTSIINAGNTGQYLVFGGNMSGSGGLTISSGTFVLANANPYTGTITVDPGAMLQFGLGGPVGSVESKSIINNGVIQFGTSGNTSCAAVISGKGGIWKIITGTLTLTGANTYTGSTNIDPSPNKQTNATLIGDISKSIGVTIASTCSYDLNGISRTLIDLNGSGTVQNSGTSANLTLTSQNGSTFSGTIANTITSVTVNGTKTLTLSGTTPYAGSVTIASGTLALTNTNTLSGAIKLAHNSTLLINAPGTTPTFANPIIFGEGANGTKPIVTLNVSQPTTFSGPITCTAPSGTIGTLIVTGGHPVMLTGAQAGSFKIIYSHIGPGMTATISTNTDYGKDETITLAGGTLKADVNALRINNKVIFTDNTASTINAGGKGQYLGLLGNISGTGSLTISSGILALTNSNPYTGTITINPDTMLQFGFGGPMSNVVNNSIINNGTIQFGTSGATSCSSNISGTGGIWKSISGTLTLTGNNTFTGPTIIDPAPNKQKNAVIIGDISKSVGVNIAATCAYDLNGTARTLIDPSGAGTIQSSTQNATLTLTSKNGSTFTGTLANTIASLTINGSNTLKLTGTNAHTGTTTISAGSTLVGDVSKSIGVVINGTYDLNGTAPTLIDPSGAGTIQSSTKNAPLSLTSQNGSIFSGTIASTITNLIIKGTNTLRLLGTNSHTGSTTISAGSTLVGDISKSEVTINGIYDLNGTNRALTNLAGTGTITSSTKNAALSINSTKSLDFMGVIDNSINGVTLTGSGKFGFAQDQKYTGTTTINPDAFLQISTGGTTGSIASTSIINNGRISFTRSNPYTYAGIISGTGSLSQYKLSTLILTGANTYTGTTTIEQGGTLIGDISKSVGVTIHGTYDLNGTNRTIINPSGAGTIQSSTKNSAITLTLQNDLTFPGTIANTISGLTVNGSKILTLSGNNASTGTTIINPGATLIGNINNSTSVIVNGTYDLKGNAITLTNLSGNGTIQSSGGTGALLTLASSNSGNSTIFSGTLASTINGLNKTGSGTAILSGKNNMTNTTVTTIDAGTLQIGSGSTTGSITSNTTINNGKISFNRSNDYTYSGVISGSGLLIQKGSGTLTLIGANTYTGGTDISAGVLNISSSNNLGSGEITLSGGTLRAIKDFTLTQLITLKTEGVISTANNSITVSGNISGSNVLRKNGKGTLILTGANTYKGKTTITNGRLQIGSGSTNGSITSNNIVNSGNFAFNRSDTVTYPGIISGTGTFTQSGKGTIILTGANTYTGTTTINSGKLQVGSGSTNGNIAGGTIVNNAALSFNRSNAYTYTGVISGTGTLQQMGSGTLTLAGLNTYTGSTTIDSGKTLIGNIASSVGVSILGTYDLNGTDRLLIDPSGTGKIQSSTKDANLTLTTQKGSAFAGIIANTISKLTISGTHPLTLSNMNSYTGEINVDSRGTLIGNISNCSRTLVNGTYDLKGTIQTLNNISGIGKIQSSGSKATLTLTSKEDSMFFGTFDTTLNSIIKRGSGTLTLSSAQSYTGEIIVSEGTLSLANTTSTKGIISLAEKTTLQININDESTITNPINFNSTTMSDTPAVIKVNKPTTFSGPLTCNAPSDKAGRLIISGGHTVTLTGKHLGNFAIILSGEGTNVVVKGEANTNTEIVTGSTWFVLNRDKNTP